MWIGQSGPHSALFRSVHARKCQAALGASEGSADAILNKWSSKNTFEKGA